MSLSNDDIRLTSTPIVVAEAIARATDPAGGGIAIFLGVTRAESNASNNSAAGQSLLALDYEAYAEMATAQLVKFAQTARDRWPILRLAILHRTGRVAVGEPSVLIAVSTPHRAAAFEACRWLIDAIKSDAAIWKKEIWDDGSSTWVHPNL